METLILVAEEHRNHHQYYVKKSIGHHDHRSSKTFRQINCRTSFQSGVGLLPRPKRTSSGETRFLPQVQSPRSPKSVLPVFNHDDGGRRTSPIPIKRGGGGSSSQIRRCASEVVDKRRSFSYSELWAGPTYSNSPPPTSVPIPKFSLKQKRTASLSFREAAKSAPVSPTSSVDDNNNPFHNSTVSATMTLRRMLNLESADE